MSHADNIAKEAANSVDDVAGAAAKVAAFISQKVNSSFQKNVKTAFKTDAKVTELVEDTVAYRYYGGNSNATSYWYTPNQTNNPAADLELPKGNSYQNIETVTIPKGTTILEGTVASKFGQPGGGYQYYVPDPSVLKKQGVFHGRIKNTNFKMYRLIL